MMGLAVHRTSIGPAAGGAPLDDYTSDLWACRWLGRLLSDYTGSICRIRRVSDNAELDIGYTLDNDLDTVAILAHCGAGEGRLVTLYDQFGNGRHLTMATAASQPRICNSGVMVGVVGSYQAFRLEGNTTSGLYLTEASSPAALAAIEAFAGVRIDADPAASVATSGHPLCYQDGSGGNASHYPFTDGVIYDRFGSTVRKTTINPAASLTTAHVYNAVSAASDWKMFTVAEQSFTTATNAVSLIAAPQIGRNVGVGYQLNGYMSGVVVYSATKAADRAAIRGVLL